MKKRKAKSNSNNEYDTFSITMELERPLLYNYENKIENNAEKEKQYKLKLRKKRAITLLVSLFLFIIGFFIWLSKGYTLEENYMDYLQSNSTVEVTIDEEYTYFTPVNVKVTKGFIFYPGERVDSSSYAKLCNNIASHGYKVVAVDMPFNYANFGKDKASKVIENNQDITKWFIGGDSLGGSVACEYAINNKNVEGIVLISSYPKVNISELGFNVLSIWGSKDNVVNYKKLIDSKNKLPEDTIYIQVEGANHSQFANYGIHSGDEEALISSDEQMDIAVKNIIDFLNNK